MSHRYHPPAVLYEVRPGLRLKAGLACVAALGAGACAAWAASGAGQGPEPLVAGALTWGAAVLAAAFEVRRAFRGRLRHEAGQWWLLASGSVHEWAAEPPQVRLDLQSVLWLSVRTGDGRVAWLWAERGTAPARWDDLRRAVYSRAAPVAGPASADLSAARRVA